MSDSFKSVKDSLTLLLASLASRKKLLACQGYDQEDELSGFDAANELSPNVSELSGNLMTSVYLVKTHRIF